MICDFKKILVDFQEVEVLGINFIFCVLGEFIFKST